MQDFTFKWIENDTYAVMSYEGDEEHVVVPDTYGGKPVSLISDNVFAGHKEIVSVKIPDTVTDLGEFIFDGCNNIKTIELSPNLTSLWGHTFARCGIEEITLPDGLASIPPYAFKDCKNLKRVNCGTGLKKIYAWAFGGCEQLTELYYGKDVDASPQMFEKNK